ncbi:protein usg [Pyruvatibacter sp.]|uniref:usg protein n=1 Tax=Pyruvatibacter sp. TaxID=1981328 RepID=UPI0032EBCF34
MHDHNEPKSEFTLQLRGYRLTTAEITYRMPDAQTLLQTFVWQHLDIAPKYPRLTQFLDFWEREIDGPLHSVRVGSCELVSPGEWHHADALMTLQ